MSSLQKAFHPQLIEEKWYRFWKQHHFFSTKNRRNKKKFSIVIPPPNVTGHLHMGHALGDTLDDILVRFKRMQGFDSLWVPGTDHAGIATQTIVEKHLYSKTKRKRYDFSREEFLHQVWEWKNQSEKKIIEQMCKMGFSCDWTRLCFTLDEDRSQAVRTAFKKLYDDGLIYRGNYLVNWDPVTQTALSDDEVEHEERQSFLWYIHYPVQHFNESIIIATTRPETMLGDTAIAVHPDDKRYQKFIGKKAYLPLSDRTIPIIADSSVDSKFGTGALKITPAHDFNDYEMAKRHHLPIINIFTPDGKMNEQCHRFSHLSIEVARKQIVDALTELKLLQKIEPHVHRVGISYRSKAVIEPYLSKQWFVQLTHFKKSLLSAVREKRVEFIPSHFEPIYEQWIENLRDWCISRQLWWGHRIPIWYDKEDPNNIICHDGKDLPLPVKQNPSRYEQDPDVLDTWFSSALWPFSVFGWPKKTNDLKEFYPTSMLITGHDILFFWVARMIAMGEYFMKEIPFHKVFLHGLIYGKSYWRRSPDGSITYVSSDEKKRFDLGEPLPKDVDSKWEKMSKSKGNVIDPIEIIDEYGTDAVRMALCSSITHARQIDLDRRKFEEYKNFANKIWNGARFVFLHLEAKDSLPPLSSASLRKGINMNLLTLEDLWILSVLNRTIEDMNLFLDQYAFDRAAKKIYEFFWNDFCSQYVESIKPMLSKKELRENKQKILVCILSITMRLMHPIAPFITEEIFSLLKAFFPSLSMPKTIDNYTKDLIRSLKAKACIIAPYPKVIQKSHISPEIEKTFTEMFSIVTAIRNIRAEMQIPPSEKTLVYLLSAKKDPMMLTLKAHQDILLALTLTKKIHFIHNESKMPPFGSSALIGTIKLMIALPDSLKEKEKERLEKEKEKLIKQQINAKNRLANSEFCLKAPRNIVLDLESSLFSIEQQLEAIIQKIGLLR